MRRIGVSVLFPLVMMFLSVASPAQSAGAAASGSVQPTVVKAINVAPGRDGIDVQISASGELVPVITRVSNPERLVVDIPGVVVNSSRRIAVEHGAVKTVRLAQNSANPPVARVVIDLLAASDYEVVPGNNQLTVAVHASHSAQGKSGPALVAQRSEAPTPAPVRASAVNHDSVRAVDAKHVAGSNAAADAQNFVFVEPSYQAKSGTAVAPPVRAQQAAATMGALQADSLTAPASAAMQDQGSAAAKGASSSSATPGEAAAQPQAKPAAPKAAINMAAEQQQQMTQGTPVSGKPRYTGEPISVNLKDVDLKDFFRLIHEISGLNIVLDPNVHGTLTIVLDDVPWDQALDIVLENNGLDRQLQGNVLRIATVDTLRKEAEARRAQIEAEALAVDKVTVTRFLSYAHSKDVVPTLKKLLSSRGDIISDDRTNALIIQDIPSVIPQVDRLIAQLDRKTQEVEIEARVVAATRTFARDIGTQLGFGWGNGATGVTGASSAGTSPNVSVPPPGSQFFTVAGSNGIPLFSNLPVPSPTSGLSIFNQSSNYRLDLVLTMAESRGLLKILSRPRVVTQNNIQALVRQGFRVPVVTQAQLGGPPTVTYVDAFLRLTVTPQITAENTIFLNVDVENTTPDFSRAVQGNPTLVTQQATTQVLVTDGGTVVIGGVIQTQNNVNIQQVPFLGNIPALGNLFKRRTVNTSTQELIFFITPKIMQT
jgi:type IV pilus assembly protein PilQ